MYYEEGLSRDETEYVKAGMEKAGEDYLSGSVWEITTGYANYFDGCRMERFSMTVRQMLPKLPNHSNRPEFVQAMEEWTWEKSYVIRKPLSHQTFYYAVKLNDGRILRLAKTTDSVFHTLLSSFIWLGLLMLVNHSGRDRSGTKADKESDQSR